MLNPTQAKEIINLIKSAELEMAFLKLKEYNIDTLEITLLGREYIHGNVRFDFYERFATYINTIAHTNHPVVPPNFDIFFSFSSKNKSAAQREVKKLRDAGLKVFFSGEDLSQHIGQEFFDKIQHALNYTKHFVLYCTPQAMESKWVNIECSTFFQQIHIRDERRRLFIVRGKNFKNDLVPLLMRGIQSSTTEEVITVLKPVRNPVKAKPISTENVISTFIQNTFISTNKNIAKYDKKKLLKVAFIALSVLIGGVSINAISKQYEKYSRTQEDTNQFISEIDTTITIFEKNGRYGFKKGDEIIVPAKYDNVLDFKEERAAVKLNDKRGYINKTGDEIIPLVYDEVKDYFEDGKAKVRQGKRYFSIDINGKCIADCSIELSNGIKLIKVEGGDFMMGINDGQYDQKPVHKVTLTDYYIGETEVTNAQYAEFLNEKKPNETELEKWINLDGSYKKEKCRISKQGDKYVVEKGYENHPVIYVTWFGANEFCTYYKGFLPSEVQWEYAARGGNKSKNDYKYAGSNQLNDVAWNSNNSDSKTHQVKTKKPNELGLYDMSGNVWEWCQDWYDAKFYETNKIITNPINKTKADYVVMRGGSWSYGSASCLVAYRNGGKSSNRNFNAGFRICSPSI